MTASILLDASGQPTVDVVAVLTDMQKQIDDLAAALLLLRQMPHATVVLGYDAWHAQGRQVRGGSTALRILAPTKLSRSQGVPADPAAYAEPRAYHAAAVFDVSQTGGRRPCTARPGDPVAALRTALSRQARGDGISNPRVPAARHRRAHRPPNARHPRRR